MDTDWTEIKPRLGRSKRSWEIIADTVAQLPCEDQFGDPDEFEDEIHGASGKKKR